MKLLTNYKCAATDDQHIRVVPPSWPGHLKEPTLVVSIVVNDALENLEIQVDKVNMGRHRTTGAYMTMARLTFGTW